MYLQMPWQLELWKRVLLHGIKVCVLITKEDVWHTRSVSEIPVQELPFPRVWLCGYELVCLFSSGLIHGKLCLVLKDGLVHGGLYPVGLFLGLYTL